MKLSFSFLGLDENKAKEAISKIESIDSSIQIHFDVMDGEFVNNKTYNYKMVEKINNFSSLFSDVHLMVENPLLEIDKYINARSNQITFHIETLNKIKHFELIKKLKQSNVRVGISINPKTSIKKIIPYLDKIDLVLLMSVEPGKGGQTFKKNTYKKIKKLNKLKVKNNFEISVDGGVNNKNAKKLKKYGCDVIVVGNYLLKKEISGENIRALLT